MNNSNTIPVTASIFKVVHNDNGSRDYYIRHVIGRELDPTTGQWRNIYYMPTNRSLDYVKITAKWCQYSYNWSIRVKNPLSSMWELVLRTGSKRQYSNDKSTYKVHCGKFDDSTKHVSGHSIIRIENAKPELVSHYTEDSQLKEITTRRYKIYIPSWQINRLKVRGKESTELQSTDNDDNSIIKELSLDFNQSAIDRKKDIGNLQYTMFDAPLSFADNNPESPSYHTEYTYD